MIRRDVEKSLRNMFERGYKQGYEDALKKNKGEWISDGMWDKCSVCGTEYSDDIYNISFESDYHPNFCPKCGADMSGGKE